MSRSRKKTPIFGITCAESEKQDKRMANRKLRRKTKAEVNIYVDIGTVVISDLREVSDVWSFAKDGKHYDKNPERKWMRK